nr:serpin-ZX [Tanacetum cinerariifolium]
MLALTQVTMGWVGMVCDELFMRIGSPSSILLKQILSNQKTGLQFSFANGVWVDGRAEPIQSSYQKVLETVYRTEARYMDFRDKVKCGEAVNKINSWVHKETKGLITSIVKRHELSQDSIMVIMNALYFKGEWENPFYAHETKDKDFSLIIEEKVSVPFMTSNKELEYGSFKGYKMIKIPYESNKLGKSKKFSMYIFLPHKKAGLKKLLQKFHSNDALFHGNFDLARVWFDKLWIPKFKISCTFEAKDVIKHMGLKLPFEETNDELSGIVDLRTFFGNTLFRSLLLKLTKKELKPLLLVLWNVKWELICQIQILNLHHHQIL